MAEAKKTAPKKAVKATKVKSVAELRKDLVTKQNDLLEARKSHRGGELVNPRVIGTIRKEIARLHTAIRAAVQKGEK